MSKTFKTFGIVLLLSATLLCLTALFPSAYAAETEPYYNDIQKPSARNVYDETFSYTSKEVAEEVNLDIATPEYYNQNKDLTNSCAAIAGSVIVGYYDRVLENLIPNFSPVIKRGPMEILKPMNPDAQSVIESLYYGMDTNQNGAGATEDDFKNGLRGYVNGKGYSISYQSKMSGGAIDWSAAKSSLQANIPLAIFMTPYYLITSLQIGNTSATIQTFQYTANHIMIVNGMMVVKYYDGSSVKRTDRYLKVSSGLQFASSSYVLMNSDAPVMDLVGISVS